MTEDKPAPPDTAVAPGTEVQDTAPPEASDTETTDSVLALKLERFERRLESFSGPVPPPAILEGYEKLVPGAAERILKQAEKQTDHRISIEQQVILSDTKRSFVGVIFGFILSLLAIGGGCVLVGLGHDGAGATIATAAVASLATVFVYGTALRRQYLRAKGEASPRAERREPTGS